MMQKIVKIVLGLQHENIVWIFSLGEKLNCVMRYLDEEIICINVLLQQKVLDVKIVIILIYACIVNIVFYVFD